MKMFIDGAWREGKSSIDICSPYDRSVIDKAPLADAQDAEDAVASAYAATQVMEDMPYYRRSEIIHRAGELLLERKEKIAELITRENGKTITEARGEVGRASMTLFAAADAAREISGEVLPLTARQVPNIENKFGFTFRVPCGVVLAITPFNVPVNLAAHKIGAAFAAGNSVILKPAYDTPLSTAHLVKAFLDAGLPETAIQLITGSGSKIGSQLCPDPRIRKITFTGSFEVGDTICRTAGLKKVTMELGGNCPVVVMADANVDHVVNSLVQGGYGMAGQSCVATQRAFVHKDIYEEVVNGLATRIAEFEQGDPLNESTTMGPLIREKDAVRVSETILGAAEEGARVLGPDAGRRNGNFVRPAVVADVKPSMRIYREELFGPAIGFIPFTDVEEAIAGANDTNYGLAAGLFTENLDNAMYVARKIKSGIMHINSASRWRVDHMPNGGLKDSGMGKEGPRYAIEELTESRTVIMHLKNQAPY
ncbi:aldehyde dehydrogenase family protein [Pseudohoeflea coraliihabitans]|uniref:Aldehyde dehydrogenase family protein n=1 Tax=Pseudohoeflea coraliihabitans TaxID=2860393 RepID=A0ABS6WQ56_9HYPH|nr:aldehyde dehydrogenase family protein [Pseudohoeflea sp. DP4N28-3]MBW3097199.1 aldehyde dehydrogenase family protein [Pseudohoeflea sp. DP4N28-3]